MKSIRPFVLRPLSVINFAGRHDVRMVWFQAQRDMWGQITGSVREPVRWEVS